MGRVGEEDIKRDQKEERNGKGRLCNYVLIKI